jgi:hypothetical protein
MLAAAAFAVILVVANGIREAYFSPERDREDD